MDSIRAGSLYGGSADVDATARSIIKSTPVFHVAME
jgi:hypothetical protein